MFWEHNFTNRSHEHLSLTCAEYFICHFLKKRWDFVLHNGISLIPIFIIIVLLDLLLLKLMFFNHEFTTTRGRVSAFTQIQVYFIQTTKTRPLKITIIILVLSFFTHMDLWWCPGRSTFPEFQSTEHWLPWWDRDTALGPGCPQCS